MWKRKWLILIPTLGCVLLAGMISLLLPKIWEVDMIIQPSKFIIQTEAGQFQEVLVSDPVQITGQINEEAYNRILAAEIHMDIREFPELKAKNLIETKLVRISLKEQDVEKAKLILSSLFNLLKRDLDKKTEVEIKGIETQIADNENLIKYKGLTIKENLNEIRINEIEKNKIRQDIISSENKLKISEERVKSIVEEMKSVKGRIDEIDSQQRKALSEKKEGAEALGMLLYSNEIQQNLRYYNTLDEKLSTERITQENLKFDIKEKNENLKQIDAQIERLKISIDKISNEIESVKNQISLLNERKGRIDFTQLIKEPSASVYPVSPKKKLNLAVAGVVGLVFFTLLAFFREKVEDKKRGEA
jgi:LPS O-antigen subunit length determinant protein (WzzB/FepE family)